MVGGERCLPGVCEAVPGQARVVVLRWTAFRHRIAALRPPAGWHHQGSRRRQPQPVPARHRHPRPRPRLTCAHGRPQDIVCRYAHQTGHYVERRFGWDCHGLPVEYEIDKALGITGKQDVLKMTIAKYNAECRAIVMRYSGEWQKTVKRIGRWIEFDTGYKTMNLSYMETVWWVFKQLEQKNLVCGRLCKTSGPGQGARAES